MAEQRWGLPFIWPTWLTGLLAGSDSCAFSPWFQAHFKFQKVDRDFDLVAWSAEHGAMVRDRAEQLRADGYVVLVEDQNKFTLKGKTAVLSGKPDIVAARGNERLVIDCKTGKEHDAHVWQVLIYLFALPLVQHRLVPAGAVLTGELQYRHRSMVIPSETFTLAMREQIVAAISRTGQVEAPPKTPSFRECAACPIPKSECPDRIETEPAVATTAAF